jgi:hypothetical protein
MDSKKDYGIKLSGYSLSVLDETNYVKLYSYIKDIEVELGIIKVADKFQEGSFTVTVWTLMDDEKYYYIS